MDNKINIIRRKIVILRERMLALQDVIRGHVDHDRDFSELSDRLMAMRVEMVALLKARDAMGGFETCPDIHQRLKENHRMRGNRLQSTAH